MKILNLSISECHTHRNLVIDTSLALPRRDAIALRTTPDNVEASVLTFSRYWPRRCPDSKGVKRREKIFFIRPNAPLAMGSAILLAIILSSLHLLILIWPVI